jgi:FHA domain
VTDWDGFQARVHSGDGIIARTAGAALVVPHPKADQQQTVDQLLALVRDAHPGGGRALARKLAGILASAEGDDSVDLALLAPLSGGDIAVLVVGDVDVSADGAEGPIRVTGRDSLTWVDRVLRAPTHVQVTGGSGSGGSLAASDLVAGIVPGGGLSLSPRGDAPAMAAPVASTTAEDKPKVEYSKPVVEAPPPPAPPVAEVPPPPRPAPAVVPDFQFESLIGAAAPAREPLPVADAEVPMPAGSAHAAVKGVYCKRGHFNDPMVQFCTVCGINMVQQTPALVDGPRPPLGVLVFDDGSVFQLEQDYVLGRQPEGAPEVIAGTARPLRLEDTGGTVSRAHALIALEDWTVRLSDHGSANGTFIAMPNSTDWQPVPPNGRIVLTPGTTIKLGNRTLKYESHRGQR